MWSSLASSGSFTEYNTNLIIPVGSIIALVHAFPSTTVSLPAKLIV